MFLFTSLPSTPETASPAPALRPGTTPVVDAIRDGSQKTGADFDYLLKTAQRESALDPAAKAKTSSATGLFQFIEQTWLGMIKGAGPEHGLGDYAQAISSSNGRYDVADPAMKAEILRLRDDPRTAALMAGEFTKRNGQALSSALGREPNKGELYAAHFMGAQGASDLIRAAGTRPQASAADLFPDQASANRSIFYDKASGKPRSVGEVYQSLVEGSSAVPSVPKLASDPSSWLVGQAPSGTTVAAYAHADGPALHGLFRTEGTRGPLNQTVQKLWSGLPARAVEEDARRFFPRASSGTPGESGATGGPGLTGTPAQVPLPPRRPAEFGGTPALPVPTVAPAAPLRTARAEPVRRGASGQGPLDLTALMKPEAQPK